MTDNNDFKSETQNDAENRPQMPENSGDVDRGTPEPPSRFVSQNPNPYQNAVDFEAQNGSQRPGFQTPGNTMNVSGILLTEQEASTFNSGRSFLTAAQIMAVVSLFIGGVLLSTVAVVVAVMGKRKIDGVLQGKSADPIILATLQRATKIAIIMSVVALVLNAVSVIVLYPVIMQAVQSGNYSELFPFMPQQPSAPSTSDSLFG